MVLVKDQFRITAYELDRFYNGYELTIKGRTSGYTVTNSMDTLSFLAEDAKLTVTLTIEQGE